MNAAWPLRSLVGVVPGGTALSRRSLGTPTHAPERQEAASQESKRPTRHRIRPAWTGMGRRFPLGLAGVREYFRKVGRGIGGRLGGRVGDGRRLRRRVRSCGGAPGSGGGLDPSLGRIVGCCRHRNRKGRWRGCARGRPSGCRYGRGGRLDPTRRGNNGLPPLSQAGYGHGVGASAWRQAFRSLKAEKGLKRLATPSTVDDAGIEAECVKVGLYGARRRNWPTLLCRSRRRDGTAPREGSHSAEEQPPRRGSHSLGHVGRAPTRSRQIPGPAPFQPTVF
ncbi:hypothetical protein HNR00_003258 [Methylorubrum rhodinum]|uniref:Uncharacterized protein n=1 Tax=Methylorubrum rhodinum TaxID=29428 RepID=A0A840ZLR0_9HYPH|nr:hypothetical protein [Methylorubrum rhodinum]